MTRTADQSRVLSPRELSEFRALHPETRLLDVRSPGEFESSHIRGSYNVPLDTLPEHGEEIRASVEAPVVLICQSGSRARRAEVALAESGMSNLLVLDGGVTRWIQDGLEVDRGPSRMSLERQVRISAGALALAGGTLALLVSPLWGLLAAGVGGGLVFAGVSDTCAMGTLLAKLPYNRPDSCDMEATIRALEDGTQGPSRRDPGAMASA